jgi:hypothetical protein
MVLHVPLCLLYRKQHEIFLGLFGFGSESIESSKTIQTSSFFSTGTRKQRRSTTHPLPKRKTGQRRAAADGSSSGVNTGVVHSQNQEANKPPHSEVLLELHLAFENTNSS